jgi:hypothetical protein
MNTNIDISHGITFLMRDSIFPDMNILEIYDIKYAHNYEEAFLNPMEDALIKKAKRRFFFPASTFKSVNYDIIKVLSDCSAIDPFVKYVFPTTNYNELIISDLDSVLEEQSILIQMELLYKKNPHLYGEVKFKPLPEEIKRLLGKSILSRL